MNLNFKEKTLQEVIEDFQKVGSPEDWQKDILQFLLDFRDNNHTDFEIIETLNEDKTVYENMQKNILKKNALSVGKALNLREGDRTFCNQSVKQKEAIIALSQAIELKLNLFWGEPLEKLVIPYQVDLLNKENYGLDYVYVSKKQLENSFDVLHRIKKILIHGYDFPKNTLEEVLSNKNTEIWESFQAKLFPVAIHLITDSDLINPNQKTFDLIDGYTASSDEFHQLKIYSAISGITYETEKTISLKSDKSFEWLNDSEVFVDFDGKQMVNLDAIEKKLSNYIQTNFVVMNFDDPKKGPILALVLEGRYLAEFDLPTGILKDWEKPEQTYFIGSFPIAEDRGSIRRELKKMLLEKNDY